MSYRLRIWCNDCTGEDPQGCFDGGEGVSDEIFATKSEADRFALTITGPWDCKVEACDEPVNSKCDPEAFGPRLAVARV